MADVDAQGYLIDKSISAKCNVVAAKYVSFKTADFIYNKCRTFFRGKPNPVAGLLLSDLFDICRFVSKEIESYCMKAI